MKRKYFFIHPVNFFYNSWCQLSHIEIEKGDKFTDYTNSLASTKKVQITSVAYETGIEFVFNGVCKNSFFVPYSNISSVVKIPNS